MSYQSEKEAYIAKHSKAEWTAKNRKRDLKRRAKYPEKTREKDRQHSAKWRKENPEAWGVINRRAQKLYRDLGYV